MTLKKTNEWFIQEIEGLVGDEYTFLEAYQGTDAKIYVMHNICKHKFSVTPYRFINQRTRCPKCAGNIKYTIEHIKGKIFNLVGVDYSVLSEIHKDVNSLISMKHNICGYEYSVTPNNFIKNGSRCPNCSKNKPYTIESVKDSIFSLVANEYSVLSNYYKNANESILIKHNVCEHKYSVTFSSFINNGNRCPKCAKKMPYTIDILKSKIFELVVNEYSVLSNECRGVKAHVRIKHNLCDHEYSVTPSDFISGGKRCPNCNSSKGEKKIYNFLSNKNISFVNQFKFNDCRLKNPLPFDFAVFHNSNLLFLIEYDGEQHFKPIEYYGGEEGLRNTQRRDDIKNNYCTNNNIPLLRIPYWEFINAEKILDESLKRFLSIV